MHVSHEHQTTLHHLQWTLSFHESLWKNMESGYARVNIFTDFLINEMTKLGIYCTIVADTETDGSTECHKLKEVLHIGLSASHLEDKTKV